MFLKKSCIVLLALLMLTACSQGKNPEDEISTESKLTDSINVETDSNSDTSIINEEKDDFTDSDTDELNIGDTLLDMSQEESDVVELIRSPGSVLVMEKEKADVRIDFSKDNYWAESKAEADKWRQEITNTDILYINVPKISRLENYRITLDEVNDLLPDHTPYEYVVEKSANSFYLFYTQDDVTYCDTYTYNLEVPFSADSLELNLLDQKTLSHPLADISKDVNTVLFTFLIDERPFMSITDRQLKLIATYDISSELEDNGYIDEILYTYIKNHLYFVFYAEGTWVASVEVNYQDFNDYHIVVDESYNIYAKGNPLSRDYMLFFNSWLNYVNLGETGQIRISNYGSVLEPIYLKDELIPFEGINNHTFHNSDAVGEYSYYFKNNYELSYIEKYGQALDRSHPMYSFDAYGHGIDMDQEGNFYYIDRESMNMMVYSHDFEFLQEIEIPADYIKDIKKDEQNSRLDWGTCGNGFGISGFRKMYYYDLLDGVFKEISLESYRPQFYNGQAYFEEGNKFVFSSKTKSFKITYPYLIKTNQWDLLGSFIYDGIAYYEDSQLIHREASEELMKHSTFKPLSQAPVITYHDQPINISSSMKVNGINYVLLKGTGEFGSVEKGVFSKLFDIPVREYDINEYGIAYTGYEEWSAAYFYSFERGETIVLEDTIATNDIAIIGQKIYTVENLNTLMSFDINDLQANEIGINKISSKMTKDLMAIAGTSAADIYANPYQFKLDHDDDYLIAYDYSNIKTIVFDINKEKPIDIINQRYHCLDGEGYLYASTLCFTSKHDIAGKTDQIIAENYAGLDLIHDGQFLINTAYEGPGNTYILDAAIKEINPFEEGYDYTIEFAMSHQTYLILYDHVEKRLSVIDVTWSDRDYRLEDEGIYYMDSYWDENNEMISEEKFYPLRPGSKVHVYWQKRI